MSKQPPLPGLFPGIPWLLLLGPASGVQIRKQQWTLECRIWLNLHVSSWFITLWSLPFLDVPSHFTPIFFIPKPSRLQSVEALGIQLCSPQALLSSTDPFFGIQYNHLPKTLITYRYTCFLAHLPQSMYCHFMIQYASWDPVLAYPWPMMVKICQIRVLWQLSSKT